MRLVRYVLPALLTLGLLAPAVPALADSTVVTKGGTLTAQEYYPTYTALVVITPDFQMKVIPSDQVVSINGVPYAQAYWGTSNLQSETIGNLGVEASATAATGAPGAPGASILSLANGTQLVYNVTQTRSTWLRKGLKMSKRPDQTVSGELTSSVSASDAAPVTLSESLTLSAPGKPAQATTYTRTLATRADGTYLVGLTRDDARLHPSHQVSQLGVPARLWPNALSVGQTWVVGPYREFGQSSVMRMQVVDRETVTVPAGTYPGAYKVVGFGNLCGGQTYTPNGRVANQVGTVERQVWVVPGLGAVKDVEKLHLHQDYFPKRAKVIEQPYVLEIKQTSELREFSLGKR